jgi:kojibiose phosphorylase
MPANVTAEAFPKTKAKWGTYVPGIYGKHPFLNNELVNLPWFLGLAPIAEGERLDLEQSRVEACRRELQMKDALWRRSLIWKTRAGASVTVSFERFVSAARPSLCVQRMSLECDRNIEIQIESIINGDVRTNGFDHFKHVSCSTAKDGSLACEVTTDRGDAVCLQSLHRGAVKSWTAEASGRLAQARGTVRLAAGEGRRHRKAQRGIDEQGSRAGAVRHGARRRIEHRV